MEEYYGDQLRDKDQKDYDRELQENETFRNQQKTYLSSLNNQVREVTHRKRYEDMMTDQERQLNQKDINAYESREPVLYSNKIGFHNNSPNKKIDIAKMKNMNNLLMSGQSFGIAKKNIAQSGTSDLIAPHVGNDNMAQARYINHAIIQANKAEMFNLRPVVSNRAYGGDIMSRNTNPQPQYNSAQEVYNKGVSFSNPGINNTHDSVKRNGEAVMNLNAQSPFQQRKTSFQNLPPQSSITDRMSGIKRNNLSQEHLSKNNKFSGIYG